MEGGTLPAVFNAANEVAVAAFRRVQETDYRQRQMRLRQDGHDGLPIVQKLARHCTQHGVLGVAVLFAELAQFFDLLAMRFAGRSGVRWAGVV